MKVKNDHCSEFSNLSNWKEEAWQNQGFNGIRTRDLRDTSAMLYQLSYEATHWEWGQFVEFISSREEWNDVKYVWNNSYIRRYELNKLTSLSMCGLRSSVGRASHRYRGGHGFESHWSPDFFRLLLSNLTIKNCDKIEKFKTILVKSLKMRRRFDVRLTSLLSQ